jgi:uncharacterized protein YciI
VRPLSNAPIASVFTVSSLFIVESSRGPGYDHTRTRREQRGWNEHAAFMDRLVEEGTVVLGGPVGDIDGESTLLVVRAEHERSVRAAFEPDPWYETVLHLARVEPWTLWLGELPS